MPSNLAHRIYHQVTQFLLIAVYLFVVFLILALHESVVAAKNHLEYHFYGFAIINALILRKVMLVADELHFANWFRNSPEHGGRRWLASCSRYSMISSA